MTRACRLVAGVDEAGRGPLAGPVVAAAVVLDPRRPVRGVKDSKLLAPAERERLAARIESRVRCWSVAWADVEEIDQLNILHATLLAMRRAVCGLSLRPAHVQIDGNRCPVLAESGVSLSVEAVIGGDRVVRAIGAASILAKVYRDALMRRLDGRYPVYGFAAHKGYATPEHFAALTRHGPCAIHRRTFAPVRASLGIPAGPLIELAAEKN
ncbi:MAG: ribonuclease HII [Gammaproteobacteria bacterium]|nr:ribonuclease HII [Gammaproteobacteria bacterium]